MSMAGYQSFSGNDRSLSRRQLWILFAICPVLIAPIWSTIPQTLTGPFHTLSGMLLMLLVLVAAVTDLSQRKIYNWTTYVAFVWALVLNCVPESIASNVGAMGWSHSLLGAAACFAVMLIPYSLARGGAGDVKLATAIGAIVGYESGLLIIALAYIIAAVLIGAWTVWMNGPLQLAIGLWRQALSKFAPMAVAPPNSQQKQLLETPIPLAGFFLLATLWVVFCSDPQQWSQ